jgi:hypothetical protein
MHGSTGGGWKRNAQRHRASSRPNHPRGFGIHADSSIPEIALTTVRFIRTVTEKPGPTASGRGDHIVSVVRGVGAR